MGIQGKRRARLTVLVYSVTSSFLSTRQSFLRGEHVVGVPMASLMGCCRQKALSCRHEVLVSGGSGSASLLLTLGRSRDLLAQRRVDMQGFPGEEEYNDGHGKYLAR
jgi:hypothetical protein